MSSVPSSGSSVGDQKAKVDRFSALPPEILDIIFDFARLPFRRDSGPLSRSLLPCYLRSLYRRVLLVRPGSLPKFASTIEARPALGPLVRGLEVTAWDEPQSSRSEALPDLLRRLDRLEMLLQSLKVLIVDAIGGKEGGRMDVEDTVEDGEVWRSMAEDGWRRPDFGEWNDQDLARLPDVGKRNGVQVSGSSFGAKSRMEAYELEKANRVILRTYQTESLVEYLSIRDAGDCPRLPEIDIDNFEHLELVKIDLPEEGRFQLTLECKKTA
ncbi:hypothetical protein JCM3766R1_001854 [Sporobolomyces carnicolor]